MGHSLRPDNLTITPDFVISDGTHNTGYVLVSATGGVASWKDTYNLPGFQTKHYIGELWGGGVVAAVWKENDVEKCLIVSLCDYSYIYYSSVNDAYYNISQFIWSNISSISSATSSHNGLANSQYITAQSPSYTDSGAYLCLNYTNPDYSTGTFSNWYLPSVTEMQQVVNNSFKINYAIDKYAMENSKITYPWDNSNIYVSYISKYQPRNGTSTSINNSSNEYWTSTEVMNSGGLNAYALNVFNNTIISSTKNNENTIRPVRIASETVVITVVEFSKISGIPNYTILLTCSISGSGDSIVEIGVCKNGPYLESEGYGGDPDKIAIPLPTISTKIVSTTIYDSSIGLGYGEYSPNCGLFEVGSIYSIRAYAITNKGEVKYGEQFLVFTTQSSSLQTSLYAVYKGEANNNSIVKNAWNGNGDAIDSKSGEDATIAAPSGTTWVPSTMTYGSGKLGSGAFTFNGSNFISLPSDTLTFTKDFSMSMWVYIPSSASSGFNLLSAYDNSLGYTTVRGWRLLYSYVNNQIEFRLGETYDTNPNSTVAPMALKDQWVHIAATRKLSAQTTIYINGVQAAQTTNSVNPIYVTNHLAYIGASYYSFSPPFYTGLAPNGVKIDSIQTWESVIDQNFVTELYNSGNGQEYPFTISNAMIQSPNDSLGNYNGIAQGDLTYSAGKSGNAFNLNGTNAYVNLGNNIFNSFTSDFSISVWVNLNSVSGNQCILSNLSYNTSSGKSNGWIFLMRNQVPYFEIYADSGSNQPISSPSLLSTSTWYNVVITRKASTRSRIYVNGSLVVADTSSLNPTYVTTSIPIPSSIGAWKYNASIVTNYLNGKIDELYAWNREITADEVTDLYNSGNGKFYPAF